MALMMEVKGIPPRSVLARATRRKVFFDDDYRPIIVPNSKGKMRVPGAKNLADMINTQDLDFVDFIDVSFFHVFYLIYSQFKAVINFIFHFSNYGRINATTATYVHISVTYYIFQDCFTNLLSKHALLAWEAFICLSSFFNYEKG